MINVSELFLQTVKGEGRTFRCKAIINDVEYKEFREVKLKGICEANTSLSFGSTSSSSLSLTIPNMDKGIVLTGQKAKFYVGLKTSYDLDFDDEEAYEYIQLGEFNIQVPTWSDEDVKLTLYDNFYLCEQGFFTNLSGLQKIKTIVDEQCDKLGLSYVDDIEDVSYDVDVLKGLTIREAFGYLASFLGKNVIFNNEGKLHFIWYENSGLTIEGDRFSSPLDIGNVYAIECLKCSVRTVTIEDDVQTTKDEVLEAGNGEGFSFSNLYMTQDRLNTLLTRIKGMQIRNCNLSWTMAHPNICVGDIISVKDIDDTVYSIPIMEYELNIDGGCYGTVKSKYKSSEEIDTEFKGSLSVQVQRNYTEYASFKEVVVEKITAFNGKFNQIDTDYINVNKKLVALEAQIEDLDVTNLTARIAKIEQAYISKAEVEQLYATKADIGVLNSDVANIKTLLAGSTTTGDLQSIVINSKNATIENGTIKNAMIESLTFDKITGVDINTTKLTVHSNDGKSTWKDNTIQISDGTRTRVQIGKDASSDYNIYIWDKTGKLMFDATGVTAYGIQKPIIRDDMVSDSASIAGHKLNIQSVVKEINGGTEKIKSSTVLYDPTGQTLDIAFDELIDNSLNGGFEYEGNSYSGKASDYGIEIREAKGNYTQETTNGYQLFDASKLATKTQGGATITNNGDGSFTISGSGTTTEKFTVNYTYSHEETLRLIKLGEMFLKDDIPTDKTVYVETALITSKGTKVNLRTDIDILKGNITEDILNDSKTQLLITINIASGKTITPCTIKPMLYQDGDGTWESFTGGMPSPNPEYPLDPKFFEPKKVHSVGENLLFDEVKEGVISSTSNNYNSLVTSNGDFSDQYFISVKAYIPKDGNYTLYGRKDFYFTINRCWNDGKYAYRGDNVNRVTLTLKKGYVWLSIERNTSSVDGKDIKFGEFGRMSVLGLTLTQSNSNDIIPIQQGTISLPITLRSLPNGVKDTYENGVITRRVGVIEFDGSSDEIWIKENNFYITISNKAEGTMDGYVSNLVCNKLRTVARNTIIKSSDYYIREATSLNKNIIIRITDEIDTVDKCKTWLQSNPITVWYELATPTTEAITLPIIPSYYPYTNVWHDSDVQTNIKWFIKQQISDKEFSDLSTQLSITNGEITSLITRTTQVEKEVTTVKGDVSTAKQNITQLTTQYNQIKQTVDSYGVTIGEHTSKITTVQNDLNNLQIGGRNLLRDTKDGYNFAGSDYRSKITISGTKVTSKETGKANAWLWIQDKYVTPPKDLWQANGGKYFSFSADIYITGSFTNLRLGLDIRSTTNGTSKVINLISYASVLKYDKWYRIGGTAKMAESSTLSDYTISLCAVRWDDSTVGSSFQWRNLKLEIGNKYTDWTPAPEDTQEKITEVTDKQSSMQLDLDGFKTSVSKTYSTKTETTNAKNEAISTASKDAQTKADKAKSDAISSANANTANLLKSYSTTTQMNSAIEQSANSITQKVSSVETKVNSVDGKVTNLTTRVTTAESKITDTAIVNTVRNSTSYKNDLNGKVGSDEIISTINQTAEAIKISASKIQLEGIVTANSNFKILSDGSMEAVNGKFSGNITATSGTLGNWIISGPAIYSKYIETYIDTADCGMSRGCNDNLAYDKNGLCFWAGASWVSELNRARPSNAVFRVYRNGSLYASNANITGGSINVATDLHVGNSIYIGTYTDRDTKKYVYFNDRFYIASRNDIISFGVNNGDVFSGKIYVSSSGNCTINGSSNVSVVSGSSGTLIHSDGTISINSSSAVSINGGKIDVSLNHGKYFSVYGGYNHSVQVFTETGEKRTILRPSANSGAYLGTTSMRWNTAFFTNSITASDLKEKQIIDRDMKSRELIMSLKPISYKRIGNGDTGNRVHMGFGAQTVNTAIKTLGLSDLSIVQASIVDGENEIPYHGEDIDDNKLSWGLNYVEFIPPMVDVLQYHDKKIKYLQNENNHLKQELKNTQDKLNAFISGNYEIKTIYREA